MIKILLPNGFRNEREYTCRVIFEEILDEHIEFENHSVCEYHIVLPNSKTIKFSDNFFSGCTDTYLKTEYIPKKAFVVINPYTPLQDMPVLYGEDHVEVNDNSIFANHDIIASAYFFLSRWEEYVIGKYDAIGRFDENESFSTKHHLITRALVNEYAEYIQNLARKSGVQINKKTEYSFIATHDLDSILKWPSTKFFLRTLAGDLFKRKSLTRFYKNCKLRLSHSDPYNEFDYILAISKAKNVQSKYYFLLNQFNQDILTTHFGQKLIQSLKDSHCTLGIHPDLHTFDNEEQLRKEKETLESIINRKVIDSRQHYLHLKLPTLWITLEKCGIKTDSSLYFNSFPGFRTGTCTPHTVFDFIESRHIDITEYPLMFMEQTFTKFQDPDKVLDICKELIQTTKRFQGSFTMLWHNSNFNDPEWIILRNYYEKIIDLN